MKEVRSFKVEDSTQIKDKVTFLSLQVMPQRTPSPSTWLSNNSTMNIMTLTRKSVMVNYDCNVATNVSTQEEADTLMVLHAVKIAASGDTVHICTGHRCYSVGSP